MNGGFFEPLPITLDRDMTSLGASASEKSFAGLLQVIAQA